MPRCGFAFPDDEAWCSGVRAQPAIRPVGGTRRSTLDDPKRSGHGIQTKPFYIDSEDPYKRGNLGVQPSFARSYGDPQPVAVIAKRSLGAVTRNIASITAGAGTHSEEGAGRGTTRRRSITTRCEAVTGTDPDSVEVWFEGGGEVSDSFTYQAVSESGNRVLVVAAEDYTGASPVQDPAGPHFAAETPTRWPPRPAGRLYDIDAASCSPCARSAQPLRRGRLGDRNDLVTRTAGRKATPTGWHSTNCWRPAPT